MTVALLRAIAVAALACSLPACVSVDGRAYTEGIDKAATRAISGDFSNHADYRTTGAFTAIGNGFTFASDGAIEIPIRSGFGSGQSASGYESTTVRLFINDQGNLAAIHSGGVAGAVGFIPVGAYQRHLAIYPKMAR